MRSGWPPDDHAEGFADGAWRLRLQIGPVGVWVGWRWLCHERRWRWLEVLAYWCPQFGICGRDVDGSNLWLDTGSKPCPPPEDQRY